MHMFTVISSFEKATVVMVYYLLLIFAFIIPHLQTLVQYQLNILGNRLKL